MDPNYCKNQRTRHKQADERLCIKTENGEDGAYGSINYTTLSLKWVKYTNLHRFHRTK